MKTEQQIISRLLSTIEAQIDAGAEALVGKIFKEAVKTAEI